MIRPDSATLFDVGEAQPRPAAPRRTARAADALIVRPERTQRNLVPASLDECVDANHGVRAVWSVIEALNVDALEADVASNRRQGGRPASDPHVLLALWVYGMAQGEGQASRLARLAQSDDAYRWLCGGVPAGERKLAAFRQHQGEAFEALLTQVLAVLMAEGLVDVTRIAQDGTRVRAWAGTGSFKRLPTLDEALTTARTQVVDVLAQTKDPHHRTVVEAAAERAARERVERLERARARVQLMTSQRALTDEIHTDKKKAPRASVTDPDATVMKMGDGGFRPAYNVQFATAADASGVIVGVEVTTRGSDQGEMAGMRAQVERRTGVQVAAHLVDAGYAQHAEIDAAAAHGTTVFAPLPKQTAAPGSRRAQEQSPAVRAWHTRMATDEGKRAYRDRSRVSELSNARAKTKFGLRQLRMRGKRAVLGVVVLLALAMNIERLISLRASTNATESLVRDI